MKTSYYNVNLTIIICFLILTCICKYGNAQHGFEKYYNARSDDFNNLEDKGQNENEGLTILMEIESEFDKLPMDQQSKFLKRMGDTYLMTSVVYGTQGHEELALKYLQKSISAGFNDINFIAKIKGFDLIRDNPAFKVIIDQISKSKATERPTMVLGKIPAKLLKKDLAILKSALVEAHQGVYQYNSKKEVDNLFSRIENSITNATPIDFYKTVAALVTSIKDGHTRVLAHETPNQLKNKIPLEYKIINGKIYIYTKHSYQFMMIWWDRNYCL